jgi:hypothetical protein
VWRVVERLAARHQVGISRYFGEQHTSLFAVPVAGKGAALQGAVDSLSADSVGLVVIHAALDSPESRALVDLNNPAQNDSDGGGVAAHRAAEFAALQRWLERRGADTPAMITYRDLIARKGLAVMRPPAPPPSPPPLH